MDFFHITIIGAGVVGLAIAEELSARVDSLLVAERNSGFGQETSSRNSEVIHAGIYYPSNFLKTEFCIQGNRLLYDFCRKRSIPHKKLGKLIVAADDDECQALEGIRAHAEINGVDDLFLLGPSQIKSIEPEITAKAALFSPSTGIIDGHRLMSSFFSNAKNSGAIVAFRSNVTAIRKETNRFDVEINGGEYRFLTRILINSGGLHADRNAELAGMDIDTLGYRLKYCKGNYFSASPAPRLKHLVYPVPPKHKEGLGIHATLDLGNRVRFGPDSQYVADIDYTMDESLKGSFSRAIRKYLPCIHQDVLYPDMCGVRPKLKGPDESVRDFVIRDEKDAGYPGLVNLIGMESPGLTSCIAVARYVSSLIAPYM
jgi:L-2-hydroxyglutarate oxidase LhgO